MKIFCMYIVEGEREIALSDDTYLPLSSFEKLIFFIEILYTKAAYQAFFLPVSAHHQHHVACSTSSCSSYTLDLPFMMAFCKFSQN